MRQLRAWRRERMPVSRFAPLALLLGLLGGPLEVERAAMIGLAWVLLATFRLRDDLADRERDAVEHPERMLVRASSTRPFERAVLLGLALGFVGITLAHGLARGCALLGLALAFELGYRLGLPARHRWLLLKYPCFAWLLADSLAPTLAGLCYLGFVIFERLDDPGLRSRSDAGLRLAVYLLAAAVLTGLHIHSTMSGAWR